MTYEKLRWLQNLPGLPVLIFSEVDEARWEVRRIEVFADGTMRYADRDTPHDANTGLSEVQMSTGRSAGNPEFVFETIDADGFDKAWQAARAGSSWKE
jgi:hypothetical protein